MASSSETNNYENIDITLQDIDNDTPLVVNNEHTVRNVFGGLNKIIKAIKNKFSQIDNNMLGVSGSFELPEHSSSDDYYSIHDTYTISNLKKEYNRAYFYFFDANGKSVFGAPAVWLSNIGDVYFFDKTDNNSGHARGYSLCPYFTALTVSATVKNYAQLTNFVVSYNANNSSMSIDVTIKGNQRSFLGYTLKYVLF